MLQSLDVPVATTKFLFGMCYCTVDSDVDTSDFMLILEIFACVWTCACAITHTSGHGIDCDQSFQVFFLFNRELQDCLVSRERKEMRLV